MARHCKVSHCNGLIEVFRLRNFRPKINSFQVGKCWNDNGGWCMSGFSIIEDTLYPHYFTLPFQSAFPCFVFMNATLKFPKMLLKILIHIVQHDKAFCLLPLSYCSGCSLGIGDWRILCLLSKILRLMFSSLWLVLIQTQSPFQNILL